MVNTKKYLTDIMEKTSEVTLGNEEQFQCPKKGTYRGFFKNMFQSVYKHQYMYFYLM